mmetsp:Transcript_12803/g.34066  ORF Transcript_12803/g.34066 Transcript_12803/m.34066 type:complete len:178 (+) Transcript_12803:1074-1607(+)
MTRSIKIQNNHEFLLLDEGIPDFFSYFTYNANNTLSMAVARASSAPSPRVLPITVRPAGNSAPTLWQGREMAGTFNTLDNRVFLLDIRAAVAIAFGSDSHLATSGGATGTDGSTIASTFAVSSDIAVWRRARVRNAVTYSVAGMALPSTMRRRTVSSTCASSSASLAMARFECAPST